MELVAIVGLVVMAIGYIWLLGLAFSENALWGLGCIVVPLVVLVFIAIHLDRTWKPAIIYLAGVVILLTGATAAN